MKISDFTDEQIIAALPGPHGSGGRAYHIARRLGFDERGALGRALYRRLCKMEAAGRVVRDPRYSAVNSIYWTVPL
jgi:hypothetical protein